MECAHCGWNDEEAERRRHIPLKWCEDGLRRKICRRDRALMNWATEPDLHFLWAYAQAAPPFAVCEGSTGFLLRVRSMDKSDGPMLRAAYEPV